MPFDILEPRLRSVLRIAMGFMFSLWGYRKLYGAFGGPEADTALLTTAGVFEIIGGTLVLLGLLTRPAAFLLSGMMAIAYFTVHVPHGFWPISNGGELAAHYSLFFLWLCVAGPGPWSLDFALRDARRRKISDLQRVDGSVQPTL